MALSVIRRATANLLAAIDGINGAPDYNRTLAKLYRTARAPKEVGRDHGDYINLLGVEWVKVQEFARHIDYEVTVILGLYARIGRGEDDPLGEVLDLGADVFKAAMIDSTRGDTASFTRLGDVGKVSPVQLKMDYAESELPIIFRIRFNKYDPTLEG